MKRGTKKARSIITSVNNIMTKKTTSQTKTLKHDKYSKDLLSYSQLLK